MYLKSFLATFPEVLSSSDLARLLGCTPPVAAQLCQDRYLVATQVHGEWSITRDDLFSQLSALRSPQIPPALHRVAEEGFIPKLGNK